MSDSKQNPWTYIEQLRQYAQDYPGPIADSLYFDFKGHQKHCVLTAIVHGNETGSLPGICRLVQALINSEVSFQGRLSIVLGNVQACKKGVRFIESDLNRAFSDSVPNTLEGHRAEQMKCILRSADFHLDFHQTILASNKPFWIFPYHKSGFEWATYLNVANDLVTRSPHRAFSKDGRCSDEFVRAQGNPAIPLEMGQAGITAQAEEWTYQASVRALAGMDKIASTGETSPNVALDSPQLNCHEITFQQPFDTPEMRLRDGLVNFMQVEQGDILGSQNATTALTSPYSGHLLFPIYPKRDSQGAAIGVQPRELYCLIQQLEEHPEHKYAQV